MIKYTLLIVISGVIFPLLCIGAEEDTLKKSDLVSIECSVKAKSQPKNQGKCAQNNLFPAKDTDINNKNETYYGHLDYSGQVGTTRAIQRIDLFQP